MSSIGVLHLTDTLNSGGLERVAANLVNLLPREKFQPYFCTTRQEGPLVNLLREDVERLCLSRRYRFEIKPLTRLSEYIKSHNIRILHPHGSALFVAVAASLLPPFPLVVWHDHFGRINVEKRCAWLYRLAAKRLSGVIAVNQLLADWSRRELHMPSDKVWYIPNFVCPSTAQVDTSQLPGEKGFRIVCVANFRPQKDHLTLLRAMSIVVQQIPKAHLLLIGGSSDENYNNLIKKEIVQHNLGQNVSLLGQQDNVPAILESCDIGVLSSVSEGFPLALIEYGAAGLGVVSTNVGQCAELLDGGRLGLLTPMGRPDQLASAIISLCQEPERRNVLGSKLFKQINQNYTHQSIMKKICTTYDTILGN